VIIDAQAPGERRRERIKSHAELTIALGPGPIAGVDSDLVIETFGPDVDAIIRSGAARSPFVRIWMMLTMRSGIFTTGRIIGWRLPLHGFSARRRGARSYSSDVVAPSIEADAWKAPAFIRAVLKIAK
jgi:hypothetical protein